MRSGEAYGREFAKRFGAKEAPALVSKTLRKSEVAATYLRQYSPTNELSDPQPVVDAYFASYVMLDNPSFRLWEDGKAVREAPVLAGQTTFIDLRLAPVMLVNNPMDALHFYIPRAAFNAVADNAGVARIGDLVHEHGRGADDPVMQALSAALMPAFSAPDQASRLFIDYVTLAVVAHVAHRYGSMKALPARGGLAPWQLRRAMEILDAHIEGDISPEWLAYECGLSPSHFARAFRASTGLPPHRWLLQRRVDRAKNALTNTGMSLVAIALSCGFADQSHFTRVFSRLVGISPGAWRRRKHDSTDRLV